MLHKFDLNLNLHCQYRSFHADLYPPPPPPPPPNFHSNGSTNFQFNQQLEVLC